MNRIVVYTVVTNNRDRLFDPLHVIPDADYFCFTDKPFQSEVWRCIPVEVRPGEDPCRIARFYKLLAHRLGDYEWSIWQDAKIQAVGDFTTFLGDFDVASYLLEDRFDIYDEVRIVIQMQLDYGFLMHRQVGKYINEGYPRNHPMYNTSIVVRRNCNRVTAMNELWWQELSNNSRRDQLSFPYALWKTGLVCQNLPGKLDVNPLFKNRKHDPQPIRKAL